MSSITGDRYVENVEIKNTLYNDANNLFGWTMSQSLPYADIKFNKNVKLQDISDTPDDSDFGNIGEVDSKYPVELEQKTK